MNSFLLSVSLAQHLSAVEPGGHLCLFYEKDPSEQMPALIPFIKDGLVRDEQFIYIADDQTADELSSRLEEGGINVGGESKRGRLKLWSRKEWRQPGELTSDTKAKQVRQFISEASSAGFQGVRFGVEMTWTLGPNIGAAQLEHWEATINTLFEETFPGRIVCQYNRSRLAPDILLAAIHTHPVLILGEEVYSNFFYQAPLILSNGNANGHSGLHNGLSEEKTSLARLDWMIAQLRMVRLAEKEREQLLRAHLALVERNRSEETALRLAAIVESSDDAIISKDLNGTITSWNCGAQRIFGYTPEEVIGKSITILIPPERHNEEPEIIGRIRQGKRIDHYETIRRRKDGSLVNISLSVSPIQNKNGQVIGVSKIARDITERIRAEEAVRKANDRISRYNEELEQRVDERTASLREAIAQMEEFSYSVSHDLRAPARAMKGYALTLLEDHGKNLDDEAKDYLERIIRGGARMDRLIEDVLTYSRMSRRQMQLQPVSLQRLLYDILQQFPEMQSPRAHINLIEPLPYVIAHEPSLAQVISNLLGNAVKFVPPGETPRVKVRAENGGERVRLWIEDNGIGIKPEQQRRLFGMFERLHTDKHYEGTGIGLAIVRKGIERMGGAAGVESDGISGSQFWIELPAAKHL